MVKEATYSIDPLQASDAGDLHRLMANNAGRFTRFFSRTLSQNSSLRASRTYILVKNSEAELRKEFTWAIRSREDNKVKGLIILREINWELGQGELAYCIAQSHEGRGWVSQAVNDICQFLFTQFDLTLLRLIIHKSNTGSLRVAEKCGFVWKKTLHDHYTPPNERTLDMELYERHA